LKFIIIINIIIIYSWFTHFTADVCRCTVEIFSVMFTCRRCTEVSRRVRKCQVADEETAAEC